MATILIVGRTADRAPLAALLTSAGHRPAEAEGAEEALALARTQPPELIIVDQRLPAADAAEVAARFRADPATAGIPMVLRGAAGDPEPGAVLRLLSGALSAASPAAADLSRLAAIVQLGLDLAGERDPQRLLQAFCEAAREVIGAKYAALGILAPDGETLRHFLTSGLDAETVARIGAPPTGKGILGLMLHERRSLRLRDLEAHPMSAGYPPNHPPMRSFLGVPIASGARVHGRLYLTEKIGAEEFSQDDERLLVTLAAHVAVAYESATQSRSVGSRVSELQEEVEGRRRAEAALRESEGRYRALFDNSLNGIALHEIVTDAEGTPIDYVFLDANPAFDKVMGLGRDRTIGRRVTEVLPGIEKDPFIEVFGRVALTGEGVRFEQLSASLNRHFAIAAFSPARGQFATVFTDITERKQAEEKLRLQSAALDAAANAIVITDRDGAITWANPAFTRLTGWGVEECLGRNMRILKSGQHDSSFYEELWRTILSGGVWQREMTNRRKDGSLYIEEQTITPVRCERGEITHFIAIKIDVTGRKRMEEALRDGEERYRSLFEGMLNGFAYCRMLFDQGRPQDFVYLNVNRAFESLTGLRDVVGKKVSEVIPGIRETDPELFEIYGRVARTGAPETFETYVAALKMWFSISVYSPKPEHFVAVFDVITERKRAQETLLQSERRYRTLAEAAHDDIFIADREGRVQYVNAAAAGQFGLAPEQVAGKGLEELFPPEIAARFRESLADVFASGAHRYAEAPARYGDREVWIGTWLAPLEGDQGEVEAVMGVSRDITERKRAELRINQQADDLGLLNKLNDAINRGESFHEIVALVSMETRRIFSVSDATVYLLSPDKQHLLLELQSLPRETVQKVEALIGRAIPTLKVSLKKGSPYLEALESGKPRLVEDPPSIRRLMGEHTEDPILKKVIPVVQRLLKPNSVILLPLISDARPIGLLSLSRERPFAGEEVSRAESISAQLTNAIKRKLAEDEVRLLNKELEQRVEQRTAELEVANEELEAFSYSVSHDLRAPLRAIDGFSQALLEENAGQLDDAGQDYLRRVRAGTQRMGTLIDDLLGLSRVARVELRREKVALTELAREIVSDLAERDPKRRIKFVAEDNLSVDGDSRLLRVALENLLSNAWKFTQERTPATIEFGQEHQAGSPVFFVRDNGAGFDMAYADKLFGAFQRLHPASEFPGTGVGLATVRRIIHRHGGRVWAEGKVDQGATFYFTIASKGDSNG